MTTQAVQFQRRPTRWWQAPGPWAALLALALLTGCRKDHEFDCFTSNGKVTTERRELPAFHILRLFDNIEVTVVQDTQTYAEVRTGDNMQEYLTLEVRDSTLRVYNTSRCNWVRRYDVPRQVTLHVPHLTDVFHVGEKTLRTAGTFKQDVLFLHLSRAGDIEFDVDSKYLWVDQYELGDMRLSGRTDEFHAAVGDLGSLYAKPLQTRQSYITLNAAGDGNAYVTVSDFLAATIAGPGTVYYSGRPAGTNIVITGRGKAVAE